MSAQPKKRGPLGPRPRRSLTDDGINLTEWRARHRLTMSDVARMLGLANGLPVSNWEKGKSYPRAETLYKLKQIMDQHDAGMAGIAGTTTVGSGNRSTNLIEMDVSAINIQGDGDIMLIDENRRISLKLNVGRRMRSHLASVLTQR